MNTSNPPFIGRTSQLRDLTQVLDPRRPGAHVAVIEGPAGVGKTRLAHQALAAFENAGCTVMWTRADRLDRDEPFGAIGSLLPRLSTDTSDAEARDADDGGGGPRLVARIADAVLQASRREPVIVIAEDYHWADAGSWRALRTLADLAQDGCISVLITIRTPFEGDGRSVLDRMYAEGAHLCRLHDLEPHEVLALAESHFGRAPDADQLALLHRTGGNPLFITEILRSLTHGLASGEKAHPLHAELPSSLRSAVLSRLVGLGPGERQLLGLASLLGTHVSVDELAEVADRPVLDVVSDLNVALAAGVLSSERNELRFSHALVADCIREDQPPAIRQALHRHIARVLARRRASAQRVAEHYALAGADNERTAGTDAWVDEEAAFWLAQASRETQPASLPTAITLLERAVSATPDSGDRLTRRLDLASLLLLGARLGECEHTCRSLLEHRSEPLTRQQELTARSILAAAYSLRGPLHAGAALAEFDAVLAIAGPDATGDDAALRADSLAAKAMVVIYAGRPAEAKELAHRAIETALAAGRHTAVSRAHEALALTAMVQQDSEAAMRHARESIAWFNPSGGSLAMLVTPHLTTCMVEVSMGRIDDAIATCTDGLQLCERTGHLMPRVYLLPCLAVFRLIQGDLEAALEQSKLCNQLIDDWCPTHHSAVSRAIVGYVASLRGDRAGAVQGADRAAQEMWESGAQVAVADLVAWLIASVHEADGRPADAFAFMHVVWNLIGASTGAIVMAADLVRLAVDHQPEVADDVIAELQRRVAAVPSRRNHSVLDRALALRSGEPGLLADAAERFDSIGNHLTAAWTLYDLARIECTKGDPERAERAVRTAIARFDAVGAPAVTADLRAMARALGIVLRPTRVRKDRDAATELTEVEELVASLAAAGRTNREIGAQLFISARTVEAHLTHIYAKLGVKNRVQLNARLRQ